MQTEIYKRQIYINLAKLTEKQLIRILKLIQSVKRHIFYIDWCLSHCSLFHISIYFKIIKSKVSIVHVNKCPRFIAISKCTNVA